MFVYIYIYIGKPQQTQRSNELDTTETGKEAGQMPNHILGI